MRAEHPRHAFFQETKANRRWGNSSAHAKQFPRKHPLRRRASWSKANPTRCALNPAVAKRVLYMGNELGYVVPMRHAVGRAVGYLSCLVMTCSIIGCGKDSAPVADLVPKDTAAEAKPPNNPPEAAATKTTTPTNDEAKPATSAAASTVTPSATSVAKNPSPSVTPGELAAAPNASSQPAPAISADAPAPALAATSAAPEPPAPPPVESPKQTGQAFSVWLQSSGRYTAGQQGTVEAVVVPKGPFHCNQEYPYKFTASAGSPGVTYPKPVVRAEGLTVSPSRAVMRVPFVPQNAGDVKVGGTYSFSVCTDEQCVVEKRDVFVTVKVQ